VTTAGALPRILAAVAAASGEHQPLAVGWATVDSARAAADLAAELETVTAAFLPAADSVHLGARCHVAYGVLPGGLPLAILEPRTEGRLAAFLARQGEGPAATWSRAAEAAQGRPRASLRPGPFGFERLAPGDPLHGPFSLLIEGEPGTIRP
jgi:hypothetical protein